MKENHSSQNAQESGTSSFTRLRSKLSFERMVEMGAKMGMENPLFLCHERAAKATTVINGKEYINFSTYDYLDLNTHPEITEATMEELYAAWDKLIQKDGNGNVTQYAQAIGVKSTVAMMPVFMWAYGADYIKDGKSVLDSDEATAAMTMIADAYAKGVSPVGLTGQEADDLFAAGKAAIEFNGQWAAPGFRAAGIDLGIAEVPAGMDGRDRKTWGGDSIMCMSADSKVKEAAWDFMEYWNGKEAQKTWALNVGFIPSRLDMADDEEILTGNPDLAIFMKASTYAQMFMADQPMSGRIDEEVLVPLYESVSRGTAAPADALKKASKALDAILAE